jgi:hypothetical protein
VEVCLVVSLFWEKSREKAIFWKRAQSRRRGFFSEERKGSKESHISAPSRAFDARWRKGQEQQPWGGMAAILCTGDWRGAHLSVTILLVSLFARGDAFHSAGAMRAMVPQGGAKSPGLCSRLGGAAALCRAPLREACDRGPRMQMQHQGQDKKNNGGDGNFDESSMGRRRALHALGAGALAVIGFKADRAEAGYGSAAGGVVSNPLVKDTDLEQFFKLDPDVQYKIEKSLNGKIGRNQIKRLLGEIQALPPPTTIEEIDNRLEVIQTLKEEESISQLDFDKLREEERKIQKEKTYMQLTEKIKERQERMEKERQLQEALEAREKLLNALDAQPPWVSFGAAAGGSAISTLIMHPVDTIKVTSGLGVSDRTGPDRTGPRAEPCLDPHAM